MRILVNGACGFMGREVIKLCQEGYRGATLAVGIDPAANSEGIYPDFSSIPQNVAVDCSVDFSHHACTLPLMTYALEKKLPVVVATTGHTHEELAAIHEAAKSIPVFFSANMSLGVALLVELAKAAAKAMPEADIEIVETHHNRKLDAPSGTALMLANALQEVRDNAKPHTGRAGHGKREPEEIGIHAVRVGNVVGIHEVIVGTQNQTITLKHEAHSRALFAEGGLAAAAFLMDCQPGLYDMKSLI